MDRQILTPCVGICTLQDDICIGCNRTIEEIKEAYEQVNVIYLKRQLRLFLPVNTPPLRLLNARQVEQVDKWLNNPKRLLKKRQDLDEKRRILSQVSEAISKDRELSNEQARKSSKRKTKRRR